MAIYCPILDDNVLYLDCKDCEDTDMCRKLKLCGSNKDILKQDTIDVEKFTNEYPRN